MNCCKFAFSALAATLVICLAACDVTPAKPPAAGPTRLLKIDGLSTLLTAAADKTPEASFEMPLEFKTFGGKSTTVEVDGQVRIIPLEKGHLLKRVVVPVTLTLQDGTDVPLHLQVDTGADTTVINLNRLSGEFEYERTEEGQGVSGPLTVYVAKSKRFAIGDLARQNMEVRFAYMPVDSATESDGLLGWDFLGHYRMIIDYQTHQFRLERHPKPTPAANPFPPIP